MAGPLRGVRRGRPQASAAGAQCLAGALNAHTGRVVWTEHPRKSAILFIKMLEALRRTYRRARRLVLISDNYIIHKSAPVQRSLEANPKFTLLFQPTYSPWVNQIERLWKTMHDTVTRNHRCKTFEKLAKQVARFLDVVSPFPGNQHALATIGERRIFRITYLVLIVWRDLYGSSITAPYTT